MRVVSSCSATMQNRIPNKRYQQHRVSTTCAMLNNYEISYTSHMYNSSIPSYLMQSLVLHFATGLRMRR